MAAILGQHFTLIHGVSEFQQPSTTHNFNIIFYDYQLVLYLHDNLLTIHGELDDSIWL